MPKTHNSTPRCPQTISRSAVAEYPWMPPIGVGTVGNRMNRRPTFWREWNCTRFREWMGLSHGRLTWPSESCSTSRLGDGLDQLAKYRNGSTWGQTVPALGGFAEGAHDQSRRRSALGLQGSGWNAGFGLHRPRKGPVARVVRAC